MAANSQSVPQRQLGSTGAMVSMIGLGGFHIGSRKLSTKEAVELIQRAIDNGITFLDNSWDYNGGESETRVGKALKGGYREKAFVMTKIDGRSKKEAAKQLDESLNRLDCGHIDLLQHHEVIRFEDADRIFEEDGAMQTFLKAQREGKIRYIGFTGHKDPHIHLYMLETAARHGFRFDAVQMPLNPMDAHFRSFGKLVLPKLVEAGIGVLGMKSMADGVLLKSGVVTPRECLNYALSLPTSVVITGIGKSELLDQALAVARNFQPMTEAEKEELLSKTAEAGAKGTYELFKTSQHHDSTAEHPEWLGEDPERVRQLAVE
ncbi:MAG: aldo/keto reductase [Bryobacteraceae bacterium]|jgi:aryl-alcohol dehydrogenase-like predicted oxidoreductase